MPQYLQMKAGKTARLEVANMALSLASMLADGAIVIPGLKTVVQAGIKILEVSQTLESNKAEGLAVAGRTYELLEAITDSLRDKGEEDIDPTLIRDLERFQVDLVAVLQTLESISKPKLMEKIYKYRIHAEELAGCKEKLDHGFMRFMVHNSIAIRLQIYDNNQRAVLHQSPCQEVAKSDETLPGLVSEDRDRIKYPSAGEDGDTFSVTVDSTTPIPAVLPYRTTATSSEPDLNLGLHPQAQTPVSFTLPLTQPFTVRTTVDDSSFIATTVASDDCGYCAYEMATNRLWPCGHLFCDDCSTSSACPTCRTPIASRSRFSPTKLEP